MNDGFGLAPIRIEGAEYTEESDPARYHGGVLGGVYEAPPNTSGLKPLAFKVVVLPDPVEEVTKGGIIRPVETVTKDEYATTTGTIVAVAGAAFGHVTPEEWGDDKPKVGDHVVFTKYAGFRHKSKMDGKDYLIIRDEDIHCAVVAE